MFISRWLNAILQVYLVMGGLFTVLLIGVHRGRSWSPVILLLSAIVPLGLYGVYWRVLDVHGDTSFFNDTYYMLALRHSLSVALILFALANVSIWLGTHRVRLNVFITLILAAPIVASGAAYARQQAILGLQGMPRGYADYPQAFADGQRSASMLAFIMTAFLVIFLLRLAIAYRRRDRSSIADSF